MRSCVIIPCYNEEKRIEIKAFKEFVEKQKDIDLLFVNDGSVDKTEQVLSSLKSSRIDVINLKQNSGKAEAVRQGMLHALKNGKYNYIGYWDADLSTPLRDIETMVKVFEKNPNLEIIFGSRKPTAENKIERSVFRGFTSKLFVMLVRRTLNTPPFDDTQCGAKLLTKSAAAQVSTKPFVSRWFFDVEILIRFLKGPNDIHKVLELPVSSWVHQDGSKITLKDGLKTYSELKKIKRYYKIN